MTDQGPTSRREMLEDEVRVGWRMAALGMETASQVAAGALLGWLYDRWQGTGPNGVMITTRIRRVNIGTAPATQGLAKRAKDS